MKKELELQLKSEFPKLLVEMHGDIKSTCMHFGCQCDDGWYNLIHSACLELQEWSDKNAQITVTTIKEKFGSLRIYFKGIDGKDVDYSEVSNIIRKFEDASLNICEETSNPGKLRKRGYIYKTVSDEIMKSKGYVEVENG